MTMRMDERVRRALEIIDETGVAPEKRDAETGGELFLRELTPDKVVELVSPHVVGQDKAVRELARHVCLWLSWHFAIKDRHSSWADLPPRPALTLTGTTASGKSHIVKVMCKVLGLRLVRVNFGSLSGEGWRGQSLSSFLQKVSEEQEADPNAVFVLFCDEVDKTANCGMKGGADQSFNPQTDALAPMDSEETYSAFGRRNGEDMRFEVDMSSVMWIMSGAFTGIDAHVRKRLISLAKGSYGLLSSGEAAEVMAMDEDSLRAQIQPVDLISAGMLAEFVGRCSRIINLPKLGVSELARIVNDSDHSLQARYQSLMPEGSTFTVDAAAAEFIAKEALESEMGARHLDAVLSPFAARALEEALRSGGVDAKLTFDDESSKLALVYAGSKALEGVA